MVLTKRGIKPTQDYVQQNQIQGTKNIVLLSSEQYTNVGLIEQLTSFFEYSSSIFSELLTDIEKSSRRIQELGQRVHHASLTIPSVEQTFELATNGDNFITTSRIDFQSELGEQSYLFPKETNTPAITKIYQGGFTPPPLQQLDPYREDNMSCAKLYSNPNFFIESWIMAQKEKIAKDKLKREERRQKRAERRKEKQINTNTEKVNAKSVNLRRDRFKNMEDSPSTSNDINNTQTPQNNVNTFTPLQPPPNNTNTSSFGPPPSFGNTPPPPNFGNTPPPPNFGNTPPPPNFGNTPPPPPNFGNTPPPPPNFGNTPPPPNFGNTPPPPNFGNTPPPPPNFGNTPPPPNFGNTNTPPPPPPTGGFNNVPQIDNSPPPPPPPTGGLGGELHKIESSNTSGGGLLDAIKKGVNLKKSEKPVEKEIIPESNTGFNTNLIAMVLNQRREALEDSDDDDDDSDASWD